MDFPNRDRLQDLMEAGADILGEGEFEMVIEMAQSSLVLTDAQMGAVQLRAEVDKWKQRATDAAKKLGEMQIELKQAALDMAMADNYIDILRRKVKQLIANERTLRDHYELFATGVQNCIDGEALPERFDQNATLLRLQEALGAKAE